MSWAWALVSFLLKRVPEVTATPIAMDTDLMTTMYCWTMTSHFRKPRQLTVKTAPSYRSYVSAAVIEFPDKINLREKGSIWLQRETLSPQGKDMAASRESLGAGAGAGWSHHIHT